MSDAFHHIPVLPAEVVASFDFPADRPARLIDGTLGAGGHSGLLLKKYPQLQLLGIDRDDAALEAAAENLAFASDRIRLCRGNYGDIVLIAAEQGWEKVDGILLDIGVSSPQIDLPERGFSWRHSGPLDMRMDRRSPVTAGRLLNHAPEEELVRIFREYGELRSAGKLAAAVVKSREEHPFGTTDDLVKLCDDTLGRSAPGKLPLPTLLFQALRIAVNDELGELERGLAGALSLLNPGGRMAVISFHSLEDRIVKEFFRKECAECLCPPGLPVCICGHHAALKTVTKKVVTASQEELNVNSRAACAKLRCAEKL